MRINPKLLLSFLFLAILSSNKIIGQTAGPNSPGTASNIGATNPWSNPTNIISSNNTYSSVSLNNGQVSDVVVATNFGFSIPTSATIDGVTVEIEKYGSRTVFFIPIRYIIDNTISLTTDGTNPTGDNKATGTPWPIADTSPSTYTSYGGAADGWNASLTPTLVNSTSFGIYIDVSCIFWPGGPETGYIDHIRVTIDYTVPTPVELISFDGKVVEEVIELKWQTSWEKNNDFYTIEKSSNGLNYMELATVDGKGTTEFTSDYIYTDPLPFSGNNYYRLTQTDYDGTYEVFKPIMVQYEETGPMMKIYPNPVINQEVNLIVNPDLLKGENNNTYIVVRSITGEIIHQQSIPTDHLGEKISLNKRFASGIYIVELHSPYGNTSEKLVVN
jgi:hypothetical protein